MNKQELMRKMHEAGFNCKAIKYASQFDKGYNNGIAYAINLLDKLDEPEKPVVPRFVADYIEENRDALEEYVFTNVLVTLPVIPADDPMYKWLNNKGIGVIVDCIRNGYEVEKEKLYTAQLKSTGEYLHYDIETDKIHHFCAYGNTAKNSKAYHFTKGTLIQYNAWGNNAYEVNEVKGE